VPDTRIEYRCRRCDSFVEQQYRHCHYCGRIMIPLLTRRRERVEVRSRRDDAPPSDS